MTAHSPIDNIACAEPGVERISVRVAGITIALIGADPELKLRVEGTMDKFLVPDGDPDVTIRTLWSDSGEEVSGRKLFDSGGIWQLYADGEDYLFRLAAPFSDWLPYKIARFNSDFTAGEIYCRRRYYAAGQPVYPLEYPLDELLTSNLLATGKGVEVHACGVVDAKGAGYLFVGQSGAGKTTTARLWEQQAGARILSDDRIILRKAGDSFRMYGTPWHGEADLADPGRAPLDAVFFLRQWQKNELEPRVGAEAAARLFACSFPPFYSPGGLDFTLSFFEEIVKTVPTYELRFLPDERVIEMVQQRAG